MKKRYYGKFKGNKTWHVICAENMDDAKKKFIRGTRYTKSECIVQSTKPNTKYPIAGKKTKMC